MPSHAPFPLLPTSGDHFIKEKHTALLPQFKVIPASKLPVGLAEAPAVVASQCNFFHSFAGALP